MKLLKQPQIFPIVRIIFKKR